MQSFKQIMQRDAARNLRDDVTGFAIAVAVAVVGYLSVKGFIAFVTMPIQY